MALGAVGCGATSPPSRTSTEPAAQQEQEPPEEDETAHEEGLQLQSRCRPSKEIQIGNFYFKKGSYRAAAQRFREATHWNAGDAEAWLRLGEAQEKLKDPKAPGKPTPSTWNSLPRPRTPPRSVRKSTSKLLRSVRRTFHFPEE